MGKLIYSGITTLDGYIADREGKFDWLAPDPEVHAFLNDRERAVGTYLYGRKLYEVMVAWESIDPADEQVPAAEREYAEIWQAADKVVYSTVLEEASSERTRIESEFDPEAIRRMKAESERDFTVGGSDLAAAALKAGIVDECHLYVFPVVVGGGKPFFPEDLFMELELNEHRGFDNGAVFLRYIVEGTA